MDATADQCRNNVYAEEIRQEPERRPLDRAGAGAGNGSRRVLLVDDRPQAGTELAEPLAAAGFAVLRVRRARAALEVLPAEAEAIRYIDEILQQQDIDIVDAEQYGHTEQLSDADTPESVVLSEEIKQKVAEVGGRVDKFKKRYTKAA